jgi:polyisoprenoid-binding protein YceI
MRRLAFIAPAALVLSIALAAAADFKSTGSGSATFHVSGPAKLDINGTAGAPKVSQAGDKLTITVPLDGHIKTGIGLRDKHCGEAINVKKHGSAVFEASVKDLKVPAPGKDVKGAKIAGKLTFNGVTKDHSFVYTAKAANDKEITVEGSGDFDMTTFKVEQPCYLGICVDKKVTVKLKFTVTR